jgi:hypothetical protein
MLDLDPDMEELLAFQVRRDSRKKFEVFIYPVMFGFRVRAGYRNSYAVEWDWCGGADWKSIRCLYNIACSIIDENQHLENPFKLAPLCSTTKPFYKDEEFVKKINSAVRVLTEYPLREIYRDENFRYRYKENHEPQ